jgi:hypothetical protein
MKKIQIFLMSILCLIFPGCQNNSIEYYSQRKSKVDLRSFFSDEIEGWGAIFDYQGRQSRSFHVRIKASWQDQDNGVLDEWFDFDDGEKTERKWSVSFSDNQMFVANARDVIDDAKGRQDGNAINMKYVLEVPYNGSLINLKMDDWMYLVEEDIILNRTSMKKFGFKVGEIILFMKKKS